MNIKQQTNNVASQGRYGDTMLMHVNPAEVQGLASVMPLTRNPETGQPEAFLPFLLPLLGSALGTAGLTGAGAGALGGLIGATGLSSAAAGAIGDFISIFYSVAIGNGNAHTFTTTTDTAYTLGSTAVRIGGGVASKADLSVAADNILTITGHTNGDGGLGTTVRFVNVTGAAQGWAVEAITTNQGSGAQAGTIAFS